MKIFCLLLGSLFLYAGPGAIAVQGGQEIPLVKSGSGDRRSLSLVVYNNNIALVREQRSLEKIPGEFRLRFSDVAEHAIPASVVVETGGKLEILEQQYEYDLLSVDKLLEKYVGRKVTLERLDKRTNTTERVTGTLLSLKGGRIVQFEDRVEIDPKGRFILPEVPENFVTRPTFTWLVNSRSGGEVVLDVSYLTNGIQWSCDYLLKMDSHAESASLTGWVTVHNKSGTGFERAELHLVAGEVNRVSSARPPRTQMIKRRTEGALSLAADAPGGAFEERGSFEYHRYKLGRVVNLPNLQMKQIELLKVDRLKLRKIYRFVGGGNYYYGRWSGPSREEQASVFVEWTNGRGNYPGLPLPAGIVRIYEEEADGSLYFAGEDRIGHTPAERKISLRAGRAFDISAKKKQTRYKKLSDRLRMVSVEIEITNRKKEAVTVQVDEAIPGDWEITGKSHVFEKLSSGRVRFTPRVPAGGKTVVKYTVKIL